MNIENIHREISKEQLQLMLTELLNVCKSNLLNVDVELVTKAFNLSYEAHKNDFRVSGESYFFHPYAVAEIVASEISLDDISVVAALLHDVVEDTDFNLSFIEKEFGKEVAEIVNGVTKIGGVFIGHEISQAENYRKLLLSMVKDVRVILVKFADRLHNMRTLEFLKPEKQRRIAKETLEIYTPFANRFGLGQIKWELEDLSFKYLNKEAYMQIAKAVNNKRAERESYLKKFNEPIIKKLEEENIKFQLGARAKHFYSIYKKMIKQNTGMEEIYDLLAIRIIIESDNPNDCYNVLGIINQLYRTIPARFKDYISIPKKNNYQSIHNTVIGFGGELVEIQIRTRKMNEIAERGVAAHWKYKENMMQSDRDMEEWVNWIRDIFENANKNEASKEIISSFKLNLYQDEIYVFTPQGDLRRLPIKSTPVDFAFDIHSKVGHQCIGSKVNGKIVPLDTQLNSGDQVNIITSKNQHPNRGWLRFVRTHKAKAHIRKYINKEEEDFIEAGKIIWERKIKKMKLNFTSTDVANLARKLKCDNSGLFYKAIYQDKINIEEILNPPEEEEEDKKENIATSEEGFESFASIARQNAGGIIIEESHRGIDYNYSKCCNPIPGDPIVGYITIGQGIKIHRKNCKNLLKMTENKTDRLVPVDWSNTEAPVFVAGINIKGEDSPGLLTEISNCITNYRNTNIKAININSEKNTFVGTIAVYVSNLEHLSRLIEKLKNLKGIYNVERYFLTK